MPLTGSTATVRTRIATRGPFSLEELAMFGYGHRAESSWDGVMRLAFCVDGDEDTHAGVEVRQYGDELELVVHGHEDLDRVSQQVARVLSCDHDGDAFAALGRHDHVIGSLQAATPGLRPPLFYSPYEATLWSVISARRPRAQAAVLRDRLARASGRTFVLAGVETPAVPGPTAIMRLERVPGLPADRVPRLHAVAAAASRGELAVQRLNAMTPTAAEADLRRLPGIGPFYSSLIVIRACGLADVLPVAEQRSRELVTTLYGLTETLDDDAYRAFAAAHWTPFRTWVVVLIRAVARRILPDEDLPPRERKRRGPVEGS
ncbi:MAG: DNA-3-methyladenine glycosylase family protein [Geodermatophilaceae bacterium]